MFIAGEKIVHRPLNCNCGRRLNAHFTYRAHIHSLSSYALSQFASRICFMIEISL